MDYFKELLDSYSKLKKRTFKLEYLNEQEKKEGGLKPEEIQKLTSLAQAQMTQWAKDLPNANPPATNATNGMEVTTEVNKKLKLFYLLIVVKCFTCV